jgi:hypothetical protein
MIDADGGRSHHMTVWELEPRRGIRANDVELAFGMERPAARAALAATMSGPKSHFPDEDDFTDDADGTWIRLRYDGDALQTIEFLRGDLRLDGIALHDGVHWPALAESLASKGFVFEPASVLGDGQECGSLGVNIATHGDVGGDGDGIEWVIVSVDIE